MTVYSLQTSFHSSHAPWRKGREREGREGEKGGRREEQREGKREREREREMEGERKGGRKEKNGVMREKRRKEWGEGTTETHSSVW